MAFRDRLGATWQRYSGLRGGASPRPSMEIIPVAVIDTPGAYPTARRWFGSATVNGVAAQFSVVAFGNTDDPNVKKNSRVVIDRIQYRNFGASGIIVMCNENTYSPYSFVQCEEFSVGDNANPAAGSSGRRPIGSVGVQGLNSAAAAGAFQVDVNDAALHELADLGIELGPQQTAVLRLGTVNVGTTITGWGRYYEST